MACSSCAAAGFSCRGLQTPTETGSTVTGSEGSRSTVQQKPGAQQKQGGAGVAADGGAQVKDLKMQLALEISKFIEEIEYQLDHIVPMPDLCSVRGHDIDVV